MKIEQLTICTTGGGGNPISIGYIAQRLWRRSRPN